MPSPDAAFGRLTKTRVAWAIIATVAFVLPIAWTLATAGAATVVESPMAPDMPGQEPLGIVFSRVSPWGDERVHEMALSVPVPIDLMRHREIHITFFQTDKKFPHPASGRLSLIGTECAFDMQPGADINDGRPQVFIRNAQCLTRAGRPTGELELIVKMGGPGTLGLYTRPLPPELRAGGLIYIAERSDLAPDPPPALMGAFVDELPNQGLKRANLLAYVWGGSVNASRVWFGMALIALLLLVGGCLLPLGAAVGRRRAMAVRAGVAASSLAFALALSYLLMVPPGQAADETHHFASYAKVTGTTLVTAEARQWTAAGHLARIKGHSLERFRPHDVGRPEPISDDFHIHLTFLRSSLTARYWQGLGRLLPGMHAPRLFITIRAINALVFAAAVGLAAALFVVITPVAYPQLLIFPFLFVPALPFFGMHFGESALVTSVSVLFAATMIMLLLGGPGIHWLGLLLGLEAAALFVGARNSLPMMPLVATALALRVVLYGPAERSTRNALIFWGGFGLGASTFSMVLTQPHRDIILETFAGAAQILPGSIAPALAWITRPWFPAVAAAIGCAAELMLARPLAALAPMVRPVVAIAARVLAVGVSLGIVVSLIGSFWWEYPIVESVQGPGRLPLGAYLEQVAGAALTSFRLTRPGMPTSFLVGFGWLDTIPGPAFTGFLVALTAIAVIGLLIHIAWAPDVRRFVALSIIVGGLVVTFAGYTYSAYAAATNLHGRYLIGWYLTAIAMAWTWPALARTRPDRHWLLGSGPRASVLAAVVIFVHAYSLCFILRRYF